MKKGEDEHWIQSLLEQKKVNKAFELIVTENISESNDLLYTSAHKLLQTSWES